MRIIILILLSLMGCSSEEQQSAEQDWPNLKYYNQKI